MFALKFQDKIKSFASNECFTETERKELDDFTKLLVEENFTILEAYNHVKHENDFYSKIRTNNSLKTDFYNILVTFGYNIPEIFDK